MNEDRYICGYIPQTNKVCVVLEDHRYQLERYEQRHGFLCTTGCVYSNYPVHKNAIGFYWARTFIELVVAHGVDPKAVFESFYYISPFRHFLPFHMLKKPEQKEQMRMEATNLLPPGGNK